MYEVRQLAAADAADYRELRLEALERRPDLFTASYAEDQGLPVARHEGAIAHNMIYGGFSRGRLAGVLALGRPSFVKARHKAVIHGLYVRDEAWNTDLPDALMTVTLRGLGEEIECLHAHVSAEDNNALLLFRRHGFSTVGTEPRALKLDGRHYVDHYLMCRIFAR